MSERFEENIIKEFLELSEIDSESFHERKMADVLKSRLESLGFTVSEDNVGEKIGGNAGNLYAYLEGDSSKEPVLFSAHMDTVKPGNGKKAVLKDGRIESDKTTVLGADDIAGIVEILNGIRRVLESGKAHRSIEILFTVAEEVYTKGASAYDYSHIRSKQAYCLDLSGDVGLAVNTAPTLLSFQIKVLGKSAHAGFAAASGVNAIAVASKAIADITLGQIDEKSTRNIGVIQGGKATNIVPDEVILEGEIRSLNHERALELLNETVTSFQNAANHFGAKIEASHEVHLKAYRVDENAKVVKRFQKVCDALNLPGTLRHTFGGADNHPFCEHGLSGIVISNGMENVHTTDEFIKAENLIKGAAVVERLILEE